MSNDGVAPEMGYSVALLGCKGQLKVSIRYPAAIVPDGFFAALVAFVKEQLERLPHEGHCMDLIAFFCVCV